jgi:cytochrome c oxidase assembly factor CtaG
MSVPSLPSLLVSHWNVSLWLSLEAAAATALYLWGGARVRGSWPVRRTLSFVAGVACVLISVESGIGQFDDALLSAHMVQHMLLLMPAPLLLLGGRPAILALRALPPRGRRGVARLLERLRPITGAWLCLASFYVVVLVTHLPSSYDLTLRHPVLHDAEHVAYLGAGMLLWWPILDGDPVRTRRLGGLGRLGYVLAAMPAMALVGAYLNRAPAVVYAPYAAAAHRLGISAVSDQQHAGAIMWVLGSAVMTAVGLWAAIAALLAEERRQQAREVHAARAGAAGSPRP